MKGDGNGGHGGPGGDGGPGGSGGPWLKTIMGQKVRVMTPGTATEGRVTVIEAVEPPHSPPPVFTRHAFIEMFLVVKGALTFQFLHESAFVLEAGRMVTVPGWKPHSFWNDGDDPAHVMLICTPAGLDRFFEASDRLLRRMPPDTADPDALKAEMDRLREEFGLEHVAPAPG